MLVYSGKETMMPCLNQRALLCALFTYIAL